MQGMLTFNDDDAELSDKKLHLGQTRPKILYASKLSKRLPSIQKNEEKTSYSAPQKHLLPTNHKEKLPETIRNPIWLLVFDLATQTVNIQQKRLSKSFCL